MYLEHKGELMKKLFEDRLCLRSGTFLHDVANIHLDIRGMWDKLSNIICEAAISIEVDL